MSEFLDAIYNGRRVGKIHYADDQVTFSYTDRWQNDHSAFPLSLSMPLASTHYPDEIVRPFISGLLPDDPEVLRRWGRQFHVSSRNPFRLLAEVGEECAGAVQFIKPNRTEEWMGYSPPEGITWLSENDLAERIQHLVEDRGAARQLGDEGQFSLAGAQTKTALYQDPEGKRWGIPHGTVPTTHIIKPNLGDFEGFEINEHFCLKLATQLGLKSANSSTREFNGHPVIIVERYDRAWIGGQLARIHQEDFCQTLARLPEIKYQNEGGPSAKDIFEILRIHSSAAHDDILRFLDALIFNYLIGGTDAHAKNHSLLISGGGQVRLAPLYDLISILPYPHQPKKLKLAMKIGGEYLLHKIRTRQWEKAADEWGLEFGTVRKRLVKMATSIPKAAAGLAQTIPQSKGSILLALAEKISERAENCLSDFENS